MNENINMGQSEEEKKKIKEKEDAELLAYHLSRYPETETPKESLREAGPEIELYENLINSFESTHSIEELNSIIDLTPQEAPNHPMREPARIALGYIVSSLNSLKDETNISPEKYEELKEKYKKLSRAVGMINNNKVDHTR